MLDINTVLSELVVLAESCETRGLTDVVADVDAAIFLMSSNDALPRNKSIANVVRENYVSLVALEDSIVEHLAVAAAGKISSLPERVLQQQDPRAATAVLTAVEQSLNSVLHPNGVLDPVLASKGARFLANAEGKLADDESTLSLGFQIGVIRSKIENDE